MAFNHKYNTDDVIIRANIVGLVNELNNNIYYEQTWEDKRTQIVRVPFFYAMSGDERFLQDYFSNWSDCAPDFIEGNTDPIPRGTLSLTGYSVLASNLTSRYVRGYYTKEVDGQLKRYNSYINSIPIQMNFSAQILVDTSVDSFKIVQAITAFLYRTQTYNVNFKGFRVPTQVGFPDSYNIGKQFEFTYGNIERLNVTFDVEVQSYLPVVDPQNEFFAGNRVDTFNSNVGVFYAGSTGAGQNTILGTNPQTQSVINNTVNNPANTTNSTLSTNSLPISPPVSGDSDTNVNNAANNQDSPSSNSGSTNDDQQFNGDYWR
jgi:hypothetical protein